MSFIFYDTETTGTSPAFDQVLQVAAVLTDDDFNEIDSFNLRCRLQPHVVPSIGALLITGMTIASIENAPLSYGAMIREMRRRFLDWSQGGAVFAGWNSLSFDEEMLRHGFYQTLHPLYLTNTARNRRVDIMRMAQAVNAVRPDAISRGASEDGTPNWRLGYTAAANGILLDNAHDALADTRATLGIAKVLKAYAPDLFAHLIQIASKAAAADLAVSSELLFLTESRFGGSYGAVVAPLGAIGSGGGLWAMFDLKHDPAPFLVADDASLKKLLTSSPRPVRKTPLNKQPALFPVDCTPIDLPGGRLPFELYRERAALLRSDPELVVRITRSLETAYDDTEPPHVEQQIYRGFPSSADTSLMARFHVAPWEDRRQILQRLEDPRARTLGLRFLASERPDLLDDEARTRWAEFLAERWLTEEKVPWLTVRAARQDITDLPADLASANTETIAAYTAWLDLRIARLLRD